MSIWDNFKKFAQPYGDEEYDDYDDEDEYLDDYEEPEEPVRRAPKTRTRRAPKAAPAPEPKIDVEEDEDDYAFESINNPAPAASNPVSSGSEFTGRVVNMHRSGAKPGIVLFRPGKFNDSSKAADELKANKAVIVNMENVDSALARRVVDFLSGTVYAMDGSIRKIAQAAYLFCPSNVEITGDLESLQSEVENYV